MRKSKIQKSNLNHNALCQWGMQVMGGMGIVLLLVSGSLLFPPQAFGAPNPGTGKGLPCDNDLLTGHPQVPGGSTYAMRWKARGWLVYQGGGRIPLGPSQWQVKGRYKIDQGDACFTEDWTLEKVVKQTSKTGDTAQIIDRGNASAVSANQLAFDYPVSSTTAQIGSLNRSANVDPAFQANSLWDGVGLYGLLRDSPTDLDQSRGYMPLVWRVDGQW